MSIKMDIVMSIVKNSRSVSFIIKNKKGEKVHDKNCKFDSGFNDGSAGREYGQCCV